jgi:glutamine synthetase
MSEADRNAQGITALPTSLGQSLDALLADEIVRGWFSKEMLEVYVGLKRWEIGMAAEIGAEQTFARYGVAY